MNSLSTKPFLWIVGSVASLMVILLGITLGTVLTSQKIRSPRADIPECIDLEGNWDVEFSDLVPPDFDSYKYKMTVEVCNFNRNDRDTKGGIRPLKVKTYWQTLPTNYLISGVEDDFGRSGGSYRFDLLDSGECRDINLTVYFDPYLFDNKSEDATAQAIFNVEAEWSCYVLEGCTGCSKHIARAITFGGHPSQRPTITIDCAVDPDRALRVSCSGEATDDIGIDYVDVDFNPNDEDSKSGSYENLGINRNGRWSMWHDYKKTLSSEVWVTGTNYAGNSTTAKFYFEEEGEECTDNDDCSGPTPYCDPDTDRCVRCYENDHCADTEDCCDNECVDLPTDEDHCGVCNNECGTSETCQAGACVSGSGLPVINSLTCNTRANDGTLGVLEVKCTGRATDDGTIVSAKFDFGETATDDTDVVNCSITGSPRTITCIQPYVYDSYGNYTVSFTATDNENHFRSKTVPVRLVNPGFSLLPIDEAHKQRICNPGSSAYNANFRWTPHSQADYYILDIKVGNAVFDEDAVSHTIDPASACDGPICETGWLSVPCNVRNYWRVRAFEETGGAEDELIDTKTPTAPLDPFFTIDCCPQGNTSCNNLWLMQDGGFIYPALDPGDLISTGESVQVWVEGFNGTGLDAINLYYNPTEETAPTGWCRGTMTDSGCKIGRFGCSQQTTCRNFITWNTTGIPSGFYHLFANIHDRDGVPPQGCTGNPDCDDTHPCSGWDNCPACSQEVGIASGGLYPGCDTHDYFYYNVGDSYTAVRCTKEECQTWWNDKGYKEYSSLDTWTLTGKEASDCKQWQVGTGSTEGSWIAADEPNCTYYLPDHSGWPHVESGVVGCVAYGKCSGSLRATGLGFTPEVVDTGDEVHFQIAYSNVGDASLPESPDNPYLYISAYVDDELVFKEGVYEGLEAGESKTYTTEGSWTAAEGDHTVKAIVESPLLDETDATDNEAVLAMTVPTPTGEGPGGEVCNLCGCTASGESCGGRTCNQECLACITRDRELVDGRYEYAYTWTVLGCLPVKPASFVVWFLRFATGIGGGIAFLIMVAGAFKVLTSQGDTVKLVSGKKMIRGAILGILVIVFAVIILKIVGFDILGLPGFRVNP